MNRIPDNELTLAQLYQRKLLSKRHSEITDEERNAHNLRIKGYRDIRIQNGDTGLKVSAMKYALKKKITKYAYKTAEQILNTENEVLIEAYNKLEEQYKFKAPNEDIESDKEVRAFQALEISNTISDLVDYYKDKRSKE